MPASGHRRPLVPGRRGPRTLGAVGGAGAGRHRGRRPATASVIWWRAGSPGPGRRPPGRRELRQRLLRRRARRRRATAGPLRLTASGLVAPASVKRAAIAASRSAALAGLVLPSPSTCWLLLVGAAAIAAAALYTGGPKPYALVGAGRGDRCWCSSGSWPPCGSAYVQLERVPGWRWGVACRWGCWPAPSCSPTTCATSPPTASRASAPWPCGSGGDRTARLFVRMRRRRVRRGRRRLALERARRAPRPCSPLPLACPPAAARPDARTDRRSLVARAHRHRPAAAGAVAACSPRAWGCDVTLTEHRCGAARASTTGW